MAAQGPYEVRVRSARSRGAHYGHWSVIYVVDTRINPGYQTRRYERMWGAIYARDGHALDARYQGPRSAYGQAMIEAVALAARLNDEDVLAPVNALVDSLL